ncbi:molybdopterin molybdotransferase MoeA [Algivirga pacifica]|uniref:Molybdopterin molybdenumtransferase n=1 Tax=Algivirga pacifica TaxID=1162670 RepID=A0ABP9DBQ9_9BACT
MISVEEAKSLIQQTISLTANHKKVTLIDALGEILAEDLYAPIALPPFRQSAMDGYGVRFEDLSHQGDFTIQAIVPAGSTEKVKLQAGKAVRIFTGAPVPDEVDTIIIQEMAEEKDGKVAFEDRPYRMGQNIRPVGEQIEEGDFAVKKGQRLTPEVISFIASLGVTELEVYQKPSIGILANGDELMPIGYPLSYGQIYESNTIGLKHALHQAGYTSTESYHTLDIQEEVIQRIKEASEKHDFLLLSGGISVGDYDYVGTSLDYLGCEKIFYKVKQKPGKPLFFGKLNDCYVFALPGNPAAALTCFHEYVYPALNQYCGLGFQQLQTIKVPIATEYHKKGDRAQFLKATLRDGKAHLLQGQASSMLRAFTEASGYIYIPKEQGITKEGELVEVRLLLR